MKISLELKCSSKKATKQRRTKEKSFTREELKEALDTMK